MLVDQHRIGRASVLAAYKKKADKVVPVEAGISDGSMPSGDPNWKARRLEWEKAQGLDVPQGEFDHWLTPKFSDIPRGSRLTSERLESMVIGDMLLGNERRLLVEMLYNREKAIAFDFSHCTRIAEDVAPPQKIRTIPHQTWQSPGFPVPRKLVPEVIRMLQERCDAGTLEPCHGPYRNSWFLVRKKSGAYRHVDAAMKYNAVTIRDALLPPDADEVSEAFAGCKVSSLIDFFSGYDQVSLDVESRDITAFMSPLGLLRHTTLVQGATNSPAQFIRIVNNILKDHIPERCRTFIDDVPVMGPTSTYDGKEAAPGIRQFMLEHIINLDRVLSDIERAGATIGPKSQFCMDGIKLVGYVCGAEGRLPDSQKVIKILEWPPCTDVTSARAFLGVCVYYRIWIVSFSEKAEPIYRLLRKGVVFIWGPEQDIAMDALKIALTTAPALVRLDYSILAGLIILAVDASGLGWGATLSQEDEKGRRHPCRYESGLWNKAEAGYDATKRECRGVLKALKKVRNYLYGVHFILETDANVLVAQLNRSASDLPGALVTRWLAWIRLFDFEVKHVPGTKHTAADGLSRRPRTASDTLDEENEVDIDDFIDAELYCARVSPVRTEGYLEEGYSLDSRLIAEYLLTLRRPGQVDKEDFRAFKSRALKYIVRDKRLYRRARKGRPPTRVLDNADEQQRIMAALHDEIGHKGCASTYRKIADRYFWGGCYSAVKTFVDSCPECQFRRSDRTEEPLYPTWTNFLWEKVGLDVVRMPPCKGKKYLVVARDDLSGWVEARALSSATSEAVARFLWEDVICRHGMFNRLVVDGGPENKADVKGLAEKFGIKRVVISAYHSPANGMVERGHRPIKDALSKMTKGGEGDWLKNLPAVLLADRTTVKTTTGFSSFRLIYGAEAVLPIELEVPTWRILDWEKSASVGDTLALRARQLQQRDEDIKTAAAKLKKQRLAGKESFDKRHTLKKRSLNVGEIVLLHDAFQEIDMSAKKKLGFRWLGPFRVRTAHADKGTYELEEMHGAKLAGTFSGNRLKPFIRREGIYASNDGTHDATRSLSTKQELGGDSDSDSISPGPAKTQQQDGDWEMTDTEEDPMGDDVTSLQHKARVRPTRDQRLQQVVERAEEIKRQRERLQNIDLQRYIPPGRKLAVVLGIRVKTMRAGVTARPGI